MQSLDDCSPKQAAYLLLMELQRRTRRRKLWTYYPDDGPLRRELYPKHLAYFAAGAQYRERCMLAANRVGKTEGIGGYELALHLTGEYPDWWEGKRFDAPIRAWAAGDSAKTVRDIAQYKLLGTLSEIGTGLIPGDAIRRKTMKAGVPDAVESVEVSHKSGGTSVLLFKSYDQGRDAFQGTEQDLIWLDEEPPISIYSECMTRLMTTDGHLLSTFTPLEGLSATVLQMMPGGELPTEGRRYVTQATWDDVPHLTQRQKEELWDSIPPYQRDARAKGIPQLGSGAIFPVPESEIICEPFDLPAHWPRAYGLDVGWNRTAAVWGAIDRESDVVYLYSEHYQGHAEPSIHADAIRRRGEWMSGAIDPAARGRSQRDGARLIDAYMDLGLHLTKADNAREAGIHQVFQRMATGRLKVFRTMASWLQEFRLYRRDDRGAVVKENDHLMDATRYLEMTGLQLATTEAQEMYEYEDDDYGRSRIGGY